MGRVYLSGFGFKIQTKVIKREKKSIIAKTAYCKCVKEDDTFYADVYLVRDNTPEYVRMEFTEDSYSLKGRTSIFAKEADKDGHHVNYIRSKEHAEHFPGIPRIYTPFCANQVYKGSVIEKEGKLWFKMSEHIGPYSFFYPLVEIADKDVVK